MADIILPNQYEAEWLSDMKLDSIESITPCLTRLHTIFRVRNIVISSLRLNTHPGVILCCGSTSTSHNQPRPFIIQAPIFDGPYVGTGDLFSALVVAQLDPHRDNLVPSDSVGATDLALARILEGVIASMQGVLRNTKAAMDEQLEKDGDGKKFGEQQRHVNLMRAAELRLVTSQPSLLYPKIEFKACRI